MAMTSFSSSSKRKGSNSTSSSPSSSEDMLYNLKLPFPWKLYQLLEDVETPDATGSNNDQDIVSWLPDGKSFRVHNTDAFVEHVMPRYFRMSKFQSFTRQLYIYGFSKVEGGVCHGAFFHPDFCRGQRDLCLTIGRNKCGDRRLKSSFSRKVRDLMLGKPTTQKGIGVRTSSCTSPKTSPELPPPAAAATASAASRPRTAASPCPSSSQPAAATAEASESVASIEQVSSRQQEQPLQQQPVHGWLWSAYDMEPLDASQDAATSKTITSTSSQDNNSSNDDDEWMMSILEPRPIEQMCAEPLTPPLSSSFSSLSKKH